MLDLAGRAAVVVGSGPKAVRAAQSLIAHGAEVTVIAPDIPEELQCLEREGRLALEERRYIRGDLDGAFLCVAATGAPDLDDAVALEARESAVLLNRPDDAAGSDFLVPSVVSRGALQIAISTGGEAPSVTRAVRKRIASEYGPEWETYVRLLSDVRSAAAVRGMKPEALAGLIAAIESSDTRERIRAGEEFSADSIIVAFADPASGA